MNYYLALLNELANFFLITHILPVIFMAKKKKKICDSKLSLDNQ